MTDLVPSLFYLWQLNHCFSHSRRTDLTRPPELCRLSQTGPIVKKTESVDA